MHIAYVYNIISRGCLRRLGLRPKPRGPLRGYAPTKNPNRETYHAHAFNAHTISGKNSSATAVYMRRGGGV